MITQPYTEWLQTKRITAITSGIRVGLNDLHPDLFSFQRDITRWALRKGRAAIFADCGLGKTRMQLEWARRIGDRALIIAPLSVARQTVAEAAKIGLTIRYTRSGDELADGINITNYEMIEHFDPAAFGTVVLDESSILKGLDGKTRARLTRMFVDTPYRLCCTATPAPNDISEIANHAEFLGIMSRPEMLAAFFIHDDAGWRLKKHATEPFYRWLASWGMSVRKPSDLGYSDEGFALPELTILPELITTDYVPEGRLFFDGLKGIKDRHDVRRLTLADRVQRAAELVNASTDQWIAWVGLNDEGRELAKLIPGAVLVEGDQTPEQKAAALEGFQDGLHRVLITKPKIAGFGMNFQNAHRMVFVGLGDSYESYYQCIRREWRFGQQSPVTAHVVISDMEQEIYQNVLRKEREAEEMASHLIANMSQYEREEIHGMESRWQYEADQVKRNDYLLMLGDSAERLKEIPDNSVDLSIYSPPFMSLYTYSPTERDLGNCRNEEEFLAHYRFIITEVLRVTKPGRNTCVHTADVPAMLGRDGFIGLKDFPGLVIRAYQDAGWIYHGRVTIDKNPQAQALRTKSKGLLFAQMEKDSSWSRPALGDYILVFRKPGENAVPIKPDITRQEWILWARAVWYAADYEPGSFDGDGDQTRKSGESSEFGIRETDTLQYQSSRGNDDERHICPLQLGTIERCIRLWSNRGETVLSPFMGIGSEGHVAIKHGRKFIGSELKRSYWEAAVSNIDRTWQETNGQMRLEI